MQVLSNRLRRIPRAGIRVIFDAAQKYTDVIHLEIGQPDLPTPDLVCQAVEKAVADGHTRYTPNAGTLALRRDLVAHLRDQRRLPVDIHNLVVTTGGMGALASAVMVSIDEGDEVLIPDPGWPNYAMQTLAAGGVPVSYPLRPELGYQPSIEEIEERIGPRTRLLIVNSPSNPIGSVLQPDTVEALIEMARRRGLTILSDEVYSDIVFEGRHTSLLRGDTLDVVIGVYSFSITYSMTGFRVGYLVASPQVAAQVSKVQEIFYACTSSISQEAARAALRLPETYREQVRQTYRRRRDLVVSSLKRHGVPHTVPGGAFHCLIGAGDPEINSTETAMDLLAEQHVAVAPGETFGRLAQGMVRISFTVDEATLAQGMAKLAMFFAMRTETVGVRN